SRKTVNFSACFAAGVKIIEDAGPPNMTAATIKITKQRKFMVNNLTNLMFKRQWRSANFQSYRCRKG
ncbi:MAG: hypothetical protein VX107_12200, partial [Pseudomonadota bacterium]|nr:hypothetical protein [Pseudomonadota bacterium]